MPRIGTKRLWTGRDRQRLRKLQHAIKMLEDRDLRMDADYTINQTIGDQTLVPFFFIDAANDPNDQAITVIKDRITALLAARY